MVDRGGALSQQNETRLRSVAALSCSITQYK
jgi:hypothetical protein